jgi:hypothetical protein
VDFRDLNNASPKDDFLLPHIDVLVDNTQFHVFFYGWLLRAQPGKNGSER